ncbi:Protein kinase domain-containing protein [Caenorhabditis elegans]|uniref:Protein kinase domain-containing protein n=1 Tax=Caenorhabditis elegans TaxID=6239 RepID=Q9U2J3_CAEEL|nr:Protein kinase domain-containing protein [Caenorhabditis elegans]CAB60338.3 Protein kinase domain-containing protein [Caenorhabditis elegans]|eukprot:NP_496929.2 Uncharacterized protein CELE_Y39G8B.5 [Caenorhabditis elegans]
MDVSSRTTYPIVSTDGEMYTLYNDEFMAKGAYSQVYRGRTESGRLVAVKTARKTASNKADVDAMCTEIDILKKLKGVANIVQYFGSKNTKIPPGSVTIETISFAMECASRSLDAEMRRPENHKGLPSNVLIDLVVDCSMALSALREHNIAHRDIKHMNILLFPGSPTRGRRSTHLFKLCDMGCSKAISENSSQELNSIAGTKTFLYPDHIPPNGHNWKTKSAYTPEQCDLWSLGCTLYFCATGEFPFESTRADANLYHMAAVDLTRNPNAVAVNLVQVENPVTKEKVFNFEPVTELPAEFTRYPKWLVCTMTCLLRNFFHEPSIEYYAKVAGVMRNSKRRTFASVDQMSIVEHTDMSNILESSLPSISECLGYPEGIDIVLLANTSTHYLDSKQKSVDGLPDDLYLVLPQTSQVEMRTLLKRNIKFNELECMTDTKLIEIRIKKCYEGLSMLTEVDEYLDLFDRVSAILSTQFSLLVQELSQFERVQTTSRFAVYVDMASVPMMLFDEANPEAKTIADQCIQQAIQAREELERHAKVAMDFEACAKKLSREAEDLRLEDMDLPGIRREIESYLFYDKATILSTQKYTQELVELCLKRRNTVMKQIFNSPDGINKSKLNTAMNLAASLSQLRSDYQKLQDMISECVDLLEKPFQVMKDNVNRYLQAQGCSRNTMEKSMHLLRPEFHENQIRMKKSTKSCRKLIDQLNKELEQLGFVLVGDKLIKAES